MTNMYVARQPPVGTPVVSWESEPYLAQGVFIYLFIYLFVDSPKAGVSDRQSQFIFRECAC